MLRGHLDILELAIIALAIGLALAGVRPYSELAYWAVHELRLLSYRFRARSLPS